MFGDDERVSVSKVTSENAWAKAVNGKNRLARAAKLRTSKELKKVQGKARFQVRRRMTADVLRCADARAGQSKFQQAVASGIIRDKLRPENDVDGLLDDVNGQVTVGRV